MEIISNLDLLLDSRVSKDSRTVCLIKSMDLGKIFLEFTNTLGKKEEVCLSEELSAFAELLSQLNQRGYQVDEAIEHR